MNLGKENETTEFKETTSELRQALMDMSAILNKHGKGLLYFGVKDWGDVCGMQVGKDTRKNITQEIRAHIKPLCMFEIKELVTDDKTFIEVTFSGDNPPYSAYDRYYLRFDEQSPIMEREQLMLILCLSIMIILNGKTMILLNQLILWTTLLLKIT